MVSPRTDQAEVSKLSSSAVGALLAAGYLVIAGLIGFGLRSLPETHPDTGPSPGQIVSVGLPGTDTGNNQNNNANTVQPPTDIGTDSSDTVVNNLSSAPDTPSQPPDGYTQVSGPDNLTTEIPNGWPQVPTGTYIQANDPNDSGRFVRYGATAAPAGDLLSSLDNAEQTNPNVQNGYQRLQLAPVDYHGDPAVDWEFEFVKSGVTRHVYSRWWETGGIEYFVYASATADRWSDTQPIFDEMANAATP